MDRISDLPDEIEAGLTSVFSKRWRNLFALRPDLHLRYVDFDFDFWVSESNRSFIDFVDRVFAVSGNSTMRKFSMDFVRSVESVHINRWIIKAMSRGILDLDLDILMDTLSGDMFTQFTLPLEFFTCKTIVKLKLGCLISIARVPENASLPSLKTLILYNIRFSGCGFETLVSACPVLEELTVLGYPWDSKQCRSISCPTLERLSLNSCKGCSEYSLSFDTPSLVYLDYQDYVGEYYPIVNLNSLVEAKLFLADRSPNEGNPMNLIKGLRNVEILRLSSLETSKVLYSFAESIPLFRNLSRLSIETYLLRSCWSWKLLPLLLKKSPNLETLVIQGPLHFYDEYHTQSETLICKSLSEYSFLSSCPVKILEITEYWGTEVELEQMKHFLEKLPCLELVIVRPRPNAKLTFSTDLQMLPRACQIQLKFFPTKN